jgi:hypothetical protein
LDLVVEELGIGNMLENKRFFECFRSRKIAIIFWIYFAMTLRTRQKMNFVANCQVIFAFLSKGKTAKKLHGLQHENRQNGKNNLLSA